MMDGNEIRKLREKLKLTQDEFGDRLGVTLGTVSRWEGDKQTPTKGAMKRILILKGEK